jgi:hypothetical protein
MVGDSLRRSISVAFGAVVLVLLLASANIVVCGFRLQAEGCVRR